MVKNTKLFAFCQNLETSFGFFEDRGKFANFPKIWNVFVNWGSHLFHATC